MQDIYLLTDGQREGPYTKEQIQKALAEGSISTGHPAWHEGLTDWTPVEDLVTFSEDSSPISSSTEDGAVVESSRSQESLPQPASHEIGRMTNTDQNWQNSLTLSKRLESIAAILLCSVIFGLSVGIGMGVVLSNATFNSQANHVISVTEPSLSMPTALATSVATPTANTPNVTESSEPKHDVFRVFQPAQEPDTAWFGHLNRSDGSETDSIVDFGPDVTIAEDDEIEGVFVPTANIGRWNDSKQRIYKVEAGFKFVHPSQ